MNMQVSTCLLERSLSSSTPYRFLLGRDAFCHVFLHAPQQVGRKFLLQLLHLRALLQHAKLSVEFRLGEELDGVNEVKQREQLAVERAQQHTNNQ